MSEASFEREFTFEANRVLQTGTKIKRKDYQEWSTAEIKKRDNETVIFLPLCRIFVAYKNETLVKAKAIIPA